MKQNKNLGEKNGSKERSKGSQKAWNNVFHHHVKATEKGASDSWKPSALFWKFRNANYILKWAKKMDYVWMLHKIIIGKREIRWKVHPYNDSIPERHSQQRDKLYPNISN